MLGTRLVKREANYLDEGTCMTPPPPPVHLLHFLPSCSSSPHDPNLLPRRHPPRRDSRATTSAAARRAARTPAAPRVTILPVLSCVSKEGRCVRWKVETRQTTSARIVMSGTHQVSTNMAFKDLSGASQARSGRRAKLWKVKKPEEKLEKSDREKETVGDRRKRSIRLIGSGGGGDGGGGGGGGRERRRERTFTNTTNSNSNDGNDNNNKNNNNNINSNNNIIATTTNDNTINKELSQAEEGQKQHKRRRRRKSENDLQDADTFPSGTSIYVPAAAGRVGALLARARRALSERRHRSVSQGPQRALSSSSHEISLDEPLSDCALVCSRAGRGGGVAAAWGTPPPCPDAPSGTSVRRRGSLDSLGYPASAANTSLGLLSCVHRKNL
ncbi:hypothetical protein O3P69_011565 [Scylla paramamosain]|uniref:Uncharacterized protein n=1 Tax=Scylla paramamosain TaxID=85552 RepID=A0AAW0T6E0_SCYPA